MNILNANKRPVWSLHRRLALGLTLSISCVFTVLFLVLDYWIDREIFNRMDILLTQRATMMAQVLQESDSKQMAHQLLEYDRHERTDFFSLFDKNNGKVILHSANSTESVLSLDEVPNDTSQFFNTSLPNGKPGRAFAIPIQLDKGDHPIAAKLIVATERESWEQVEQRIHLTLLAGIIFATLLSTTLALLLVQRVIVLLQQAGRSVAKLRTDTPTQLQADDFPRELQPFIETFNLGLDRLYTAIERERRFSRDVAHELRTPLAAIRLNAEGAQITNDPNYVRPSLQAIVTACARMERCVDTLLFLAKLESAQILPEPDPLDLTVVIQELLTAISPIQINRELILCTELPNSAWVQSDLGIIERIISNLLNNAFEYAPQDSTVTCELNQHTDGWVLTISNEAPELEVSDLAHFGHRFWRKQIEGSTNLHAGLGLALALALAHTINLSLQFSLEKGRLTSQLGPWAAI